MNLFAPRRNPATFIRGEIFRHLLRELIFSVAVLVLALTFVQASSAEETDPFRIYGVKVVTDDPVLSRALVMAASEAAQSYGIQRQHTLRVIESLDLQRIFDESALDATEHTQFVTLQKTGVLQGPKPSKFILVTGIMGGGCISVPNWGNVDRAYGERPSAVTDMRCAKTDAGLDRLLKVAMVAMSM